MEKRKWKPERKHMCCVHLTKELYLFLKEVKKLVPDNKQYKQWKVAKYLGRRFTCTRMHARAHTHVNAR